MKWFAGGKERQEAVLKILVVLNDSLSDEMPEKPLKELIAKYILEFRSPNRPVPYILNAFNLEVAHCLRENQIELSKRQLQAFEKIRQFSTIKYAFSI